jgi:hypothetical protein
MHGFMPIVLEAVSLDDFINDTLYSIKSLVKESFLDNKFKEDMYADGLYIRSMHITDRVPGSYEGICIPRILTRDPIYNLTNVPMKYAYFLNQLPTKDDTLVRLQNEINTIKRRPIFIEYMNLFIK